MNGASRDQERLRKAVEDREVVGGASLLTHADPRCRRTSSMTAARILVGLNIGSCALGAPCRLLGIAFDKR